MGFAFFQYVLPKKILSVLAGILANVKNPKVKNYVIQKFITQYHVNMSEALIEDPCAYEHFNDFFTRKLKPECRPLIQTNIISPVDGSISEIGAIHEGQLIQAKGKYYSVKELLACNQSIADQFLQGRFATLYLSPKDYHRVHMPLDAKLESMTYIPGSLFSVQPATALAIPKLFARNERLAIFFTTSLGPMVMVMVGAVIVGAMETVWHGEIKRSRKSFSVDYSKDEIFLTQGEEMGLFKLGSTVVLLFAHGEKVQWAPALKAGSPILFGESMESVHFKETIELVQ